MAVKASMYLDKRRPAQAASAHAWRAAFAALALLGGLSGCVAVPLAPASSEARPDARTLHVVSHGWHTGIVLRGADVRADAWPARGDFPGAGYLEVGWGNRAYYQAPDAGVWLALKAAVWATPGVLHVVAFDGAVADYFSASEVIELDVSADGLRRLIDHLRASHELDGAGQPIPLGPGLYGHSRFYASRERFHLLRTCNVWVATALRQAGLALQPALTISADSLMARLRAIGRVQRGATRSTAPP